MVIDQNSKSQRIHDFLGVLKELGRPEDEIRGVQRKTHNFPKKLYRYRPLSPNSLKYRLSEIGGQMFMPLNSRLNDPFDIIQLYNTEDYNHMVCMFIKNPAFVKYVHQHFGSLGFTKEEIQQFLSSDKPLDFLICRATHINYVPPFFQSILQGDFYKLLEKSYFLNDFICRIASFTETYDNMPMWTSYASDYSGICLEYEVSDESICNNIFPIIYTESIPNMLEYFSKRQRFEDFWGEITTIYPKEHLSALRLFKTLDWSYEKEWRYIYDCGDEMLDHLYTSDPRFAKIINESCPINSSTGEGTITEEALKPITSFIFDNIISLPQPKGMIIDYKPCRIYLGHKITDSGEIMIRSLAASLGIEVLKMKVTARGYEPFTIEKINQGKALELVKKAEELCENHQYDEIIRLCTRSLEFCPRADAYRLRGACILVGLNDPNRALEDYNKALEIDPYDMIAHASMGSIYSLLYKSTFVDEKYLRAVREFSFCLEHFPTDSIYMELADVHIAKGKYDLAIKAIKMGLNQCVGSVSEIHKYTEIPDYMETLRKNPKFFDLIKDDPDLTFLLDKVEIFGNVETLTKNSLSPELITNKPDLTFLIDKRFCEDCQFSKGRLQSENGRILQEDYVDKDYPQTQ